MSSDPTFQADEERRYRSVLAQAEAPVEQQLRVLGAALGDPAWRVRRAAVHILRTIQPAQPLWPVLLSGLEDVSNAGRRAAALDVLVLQKKQLAQEIQSLAEHPQAPLRKYAIDALGRDPDRHGIALLIQLIEDRDANVRSAAVEALARARSPLAVQALHRLISSAQGSDPLQIVAALRGLVEAGARLERSLLDPLLDNPLFLAPSLRLLARCEGRDVVPLLVQGVQSRTRAARRAALLGLHEIGRGSNAGRQRVVRYLQGRPALLHKAILAEYDSPVLADVRACTSLVGWVADPDLVVELYRRRHGRPLDLALLDALRACGKAGVNKLAAVLEHIDPIDRLAAIDALIELGDAAVVPALAPLVDINQGSVAVSAARAVGCLGLAEHREVLTPGLECEDPVLANACREALAQMNARWGEPTHKPSAQVLADRRARVEAPQGRCDPAHPRVSLDAATLVRIRDSLQQRYGIYFADDSLQRLRQRLRPLFASFEQLQGSELPDVVSQQEPATRLLREQLIELITTHESYFFRERKQLRALAEEIFPDIAERKQRQRRLRVWSAGCSTGEEVYTVSMLVADSGLFVGWDVEILGTDLSPRVIEQARRAAYGANSFRDDDAGYRQRHFERQPGGRLQVKKDIRRRCRFEVLNLFDAAALKRLPHFDVILCRNVLIYFDNDAKLGLAHQFFRRLVPGGYLLLGHAESLLTLNTDFEVVTLRHDLVYRRSADRGELSR